MNFFKPRHFHESVEAATDIRNELKITLYCTSSLKRLSSAQAVPQITLRAYLALICERISTRRVALNFLLN